MGDSICPSLIARYPQTSEPALRIAHAYAYGGCLIQDIGYYPFGKKFFSDLAHYVRSGHFVATMLHNARNVNEFAFAVGALRTMSGTQSGHSAVNPATALTFPDLEARYGPIVTYEDAPIAHFRTEFGFDVAEAAWERYAPRGYRKHIGFRVARQLLYRTFRETYGLPTRGILGPARSALPAYRWSVASLLPAFLGAQIVRLRDHLPIEKRDQAQTEFLFTVAQSEYASANWPSTYAKPGDLRAHLLASVIFIIPKVGRLKALDTESPSIQTEDLFLQSVNHSVISSGKLISRLSANPDGDLQLEDLDLDTGNKAAPGASVLVDQAHAKLVIEIAHGVQALVRTSQCSTDVLR